MTMRYADTSSVAMQVSRGVVVATIQVDLDDDVLARFRDDLLHRVRQSGARAVILDVSGLETLDSEELAALRRIMTMCGVMGTVAVLAGLQPGVVSSLIEAGAEVDGLLAAGDLDHAFALLEPDEPAPVADGAKPDDGGVNAQGEGNDEPGTEGRQPGRAAG